MGSITIFTEQFGTDNYADIVRLSNVGNLAPITLTSADTVRKYLSAKNCVWDAATTFMPDMSLTEDEIVASLITAFADLQAGTIEAITLSIPLFLLMQERPEFSPRAEVTIFTQSFADSNPVVNRFAPVHLVGQSGTTYKVVLNQPWVGAYIPDLSQSQANIITGLVNAFNDLIAGTIEAITVPVTIYLQIQQRPEFNQ